MNNSKFLNLTEFLITKRDKGISADDAYSEAEIEFGKIKSESKIVIKYVLNPTQDILKEEAIDFANIFNEQSLVLNDEPMYAGPGFIHFVIYLFANQPVLKFIGEEVAHLGIDAVILKGISKFIKLFRKSADINTVNPLYIRIEGKDNSNLQFRFFSFFESEDIENALKAIPETIREVKFDPEMGKILLFDTRRKRWFLQACEPSEKNQ